MLKTWTVRDYCEDQYTDFVDKKVKQYISLRIWTKHEDGPDINIDGKFVKTCRQMLLYGRRIADSRGDSMQLARDMFMVEPLKFGDEVVVMDGDGFHGLYKVKDDEDEPTKRYIVKKWKIE